jgi:hypothetical protein
MTDKEGVKAAKSGGGQPCSHPEDKLAQGWSESGIKSQETAKPGEPREGDSHGKGAPGQDFGPVNTRG